MAVDRSKPSGKRKADEMESSTKEVPDNDTTPEFLSGLTFCVVTAGIGKARSDIFKKQINKFKGCVTESFNDSVTHMIVDDKMEFERLTRILKTEPAAAIKILKSQWLSSCIREKKLTDCEDYLIKRKAPKPIKPSCILSSDSTTKSEKVETIPVPTAPSTSAASAEEPPTKVPKVGVMFRTYHKTQGADAENSDADSDYVASGDEEKNSDEEGGPKASTAAADFPQARRLPVGIFSHNRFPPDKMAANTDLIHWRIYAALGGNELTHCLWCVYKLKPKQIGQHFADDTKMPSLHMLQWNNCLYTVWTYSHLL